MEDNDDASKLPGGWRQFVEFGDWPHTLVVERLQDKISLAIEHPIKEYTTRAVFSPERAVEIAEFILRFAAQTPAYTDCQGPYQDLMEKALRTLAEVLRKHRKLPLFDQLFPEPPEPKEDKPFEWPEGRALEEAHALFRRLLRAVEHERDWWGVDLGPDLSSLVEEIEDHLIWFGE